MQYGMILSDEGDNFNLLGDEDANWNDSDLANLGGIMSSDFDVIDAPPGQTTMTPAYPGYDLTTVPSGTVPVDQLPSRPIAILSSLTVAPVTPPVVTFDFQRNRRFLRLHR